MPKEFLEYEVFISSPSDVKLERDTIEEAIELINQLNGDKEGFRLKPVRWEKDVVSQIGGDPQTIINTQIGNEYDIFVGVLCNRFGQETAEYDSGTEEEFYQAYQRQTNEVNKPEILFYFKDPRKSQNPIDAEQFLKVANFKSKLGGLGVYSEFETHESLKTLVVAALVKAVERLKDRKNELQTAHLKVLEPTFGGILVPVDEIDEDIGLIELTETTLDSLESFGELLGTMTEATQRLGKKMETRTAEIENISATGDTRRDQRAIKGLLEKIAAEMQRYSQILDQSVPEARHEFSRALKSMQHAVIISNQDGLSGEGEIDDLVSELMALEVNLDTVNAQITGFRNAIASAPRLTSKLNQAKRRTLKSVDGLSDFISEAMLNISTTLQAIES